MTDSIKQPASTLILLGATGDLSQRMLIPSLFGLHADGLLPPGFRLVGAARRAMSDAEFRDFAKAAVGKYLPRDRQNGTRLAAFLVQRAISDPTLAIFLHWSVTRYTLFQPPRADQMWTVIVRVSTLHHIQTFSE